MSIVHRHLESMSTGSGPVPVYTLPRGASAVIESVAEHQDPRVRRRLLDLGLRPGSPVHLVRKAPFGGPLVLRVADYDIALRPSEARCLLVDVA